MSGSHRVEKRCASCLRVIALADVYCSESCKLADERCLREREQRSAS